MSPKFARVALVGKYQETVTGTVKELADKYDLALETMVGFLDGINDSLIKPNPIDTMDENTEVNLGFDKKKLYKNMVDALDEMQILSIGTYVIDKLNSDDLHLLKLRAVKQ